MAGNRVEELEAKVRELEATVDGLTDELVETKERLHALESEVEPSVGSGIVEGKSTRAAAKDQPLDAAPEEPEPGSQEKVEESVEQADPADDGEASADEAKGEEAEGEDEADELGDDIIVA